MAFFVTYEPSADMFATAEELDGIARVAPVSRVVKAAPRVQARRGQAPQKKKKDTTPAELLASMGLLKLSAPPSMKAEPSSPLMQWNAVYTALPVYKPPPKPLTPVTTAPTVAAPAPAPQPPQPRLWAPVATAPTPAPRAVATAPMAAPRAVTWPARFGGRKDSFMKIPCILN